MGLRMVYVPCWHVLHHDGGLGGLYFNRKPVTDRHTSTTSRAKTPLAPAMLAQL